MEHLAYPSDPVHPLVRVPYHGKYRYDSGSFTDFPDRCGFDKSQFWYAGDWSIIPKEDQDSFFQAWLFFGVLSDVIGADLDDFIDKEQQVITTERLPHWAQRWKKEKFPGWSTSRRLQERRRVRAVLQEARNIVILLDGVDDNGKPLTDVSEEVALSIILLGNTLEEMQDSYSPNTLLGLPSDKEIDESFVGWPASRYERRQMLAKGLCEKEIDRLRTYMNTPGMLYCAALPKIGRQADHSQCSKASCVADNVNEATYVTAHIDNCEGCGGDGPDTLELSTALENGSFPVIGLTKSKSTQSIEVSVKPFTSNLSFTAISHVWADGLGNPTHNVLPKCQLDRLYQLLSALRQHSNLQGGKLREMLPRTMGRDSLSKTRSTMMQWNKQETVYLWMDTLCIPLERRLRKIAIKKMATVYDKAHRVLMLDRSLCSIDAAQPPEEITLRLALSPWMRRAWTLQEGRLTQNLFIQCKDRPHHIVHLFEGLSQRSNRDSHNVTLMECVHVFISLFPYWEQSWRNDNREQIEQDFPGIHDELRLRNTSHYEDKLICLAILLGLDMNKIMNAEGEERTVEVYKQLPYIPRSFLWHRQPRLGVPGFEWAARDLVGGVRAFGKFFSCTALNEQGLLLESPGLLCIGRTAELKDSMLQVVNWQSNRAWGLSWKTKVENKILQAAEASEWTALGILLEKKQWLNHDEEATGAIILLEIEATSLQQLKNITSVGNTIRGKYLGSADIIAHKQSVVDTLRKQKLDYEESVRPIMERNSDIEAALAGESTMKDSEGQRALESFKELQLKDPFRAALLKKYGRGFIALPWVWNSFDGEMRQDSQKWCVA